MSENRVVIVDQSNKTIQDINTLVSAYKVMGSHVEVRSSRPEVASLITSLIGNMNKVVMVNGVVIKSFDLSYVIGDVCGWFEVSDTYYM